MSTPLYDRLKGYAEKNRISFAMPGHKNGRGLKKDLLSLDVTELPLTENLHGGTQYVAEAEKLLSALYGSERSYILTGGSTGAIQAMICGAVKRGGTLLAAADCHMSVINTCTLLGIKIRFFKKDISNDFCTPAKTSSALEYLTDDIDAVILTSPNYYGICSDIKRIAEECHKKSIPLLVDEAHGAHFVSADIFPETAVKYADAVCHSAHKTLNALNGAAYLHVNGNLLNKDRIEKSLYMLQSSSPSYVIAASADVARDELNNPSAWIKTARMCGEFKEKAKKIGIKFLENDDPTRLVLSLAHLGFTGCKVLEALENGGIDIEMADLISIVLIVTPSNTAEDMDKLFETLSDLVAVGKTETNKKIEIVPPDICSKTLSPTDVFFAPQSMVKLTESEGKISASAVVPYPPGIPVIYPGERIRREQIEYTQKISASGIEITGIENGYIAVSESENE